MTTIIATENFNVTEPSSKLEQTLNQEMLEKILKELKKLNLHMSFLTDEVIKDAEVE